MTTLTAKPRVVKEPRAKRQLAPLAMQREMHDARQEPEWRSWPLIAFRAFVVSLVSRARPDIGHEVRNAGPHGQCVVAEICEGLPSMTEPNGLTLRNTSEALVVLGPDFKEVARFRYAELVEPFSLCTLHPLGDPGGDAKAAAKRLAKSRRTDVIHNEVNAVLANVGRRSPDETGTSTPAGILANDPDAQAAAAAKEERNFGGKVTSKIKLKSCIRHPANRVPSQAEIDDMAESLKVDGMLEKPVLRLNGPGGIQILSGETRILAAKKLGWHEADMETVRCDDARALELLAIYNAKRTDLNAIQKAQMIQHLCRPKAEGGSGLTREAAGKIYKLESGSAASNLVRLLELPPKWQDRVSAGELPESFARTLLRVSHAPRLLDILEKSWERHHAQKQCEFCTGRRQNGPCWESRDWMESTAQALIDDFTRPVKDGVKFGYHYNELSGKLQNYHRYTGDYPMLFDIRDEGLERKLEIHEFTVDKKPAPRATNIALYDKLQVPLIKQFVEKRDKQRADKEGRDRLGRNTAKKREPTAAERKEQAAARTRQLSERIAAWRHKLLRRACAKAIADEQDSGLRVVLAHAADRCVPHGGLTFTEALLQVRKVQPRKRGWSDEYWPVVASIAEDPEELVIAELAQAILAHESKDWKRPTLPHSFVDSYAEWLDVDLKAEWEELQDGPQADVAMLEEFFLLHQTDQLRDLAKELGKFMPESATRAGMVKLLLAFQGRYPLPKCVTPATKRKKGAK